MAGRKVGIIGLGYVGLPLGVAFAEAGHEVIGLDADPRKVEALKARESYIEDVPSERLAAVGDSLGATADYDDLKPCDAIVICVPTPLTSSARARPRPTWSTPATSLARCCRRDSWWCSSPRPTRAPPASA